MHYNHLDFFKWKNEVIIFIIVEYLDGNDCRIVNKFLFYKASIDNFDEIEIKS
jgi:hypothetical protein